MSSVHAACIPINWPKDSQKCNYFFPACSLGTLFINHAPMSPATKTIKSYVCSAINSTTLLKKLRMAPVTVPMMAGNASTVFPAGLLSASANLFNHFFKALSSFGGEAGTRPPLPPPKLPMPESTIIVIPVTKN